MKNKQPKVSIGMPVWNGEPFIKQAIDSLLAQDFKDFEIIISDNVSTDDTEKICEEYTKKDTRIRYIRQKKNIGLDKNFNFVLDKAIGEYFMWAAYDDLWEPKYISEMVKILDNNTSIILVSCIKDEIDKRGNLIEVGCYHHEGVFPKGTTFQKALTFLLKGLIPYPIYGLMRTQYIKKEGWPINSKKNLNKLNRGTYAADYIIPFRLIFEGDFYVVDKVLFHHRDMRKDTDTYPRSQKKIDMVSFFILKGLTMFTDVHGYVANLRRIIFKSDLNIYQKYFLFCVTGAYEFKVVIGRLFYYFRFILKLFIFRTYKKEFYEDALKYNPAFKGKRTERKYYNKANERE